MMNVFSRMWNDDAGYIISTEMLLIFVILVLGLIAGWANLRMAIVNEFTESANTILTLNQSYTISALSGCSGTSGGSNATDTVGSTTVVATAATANLVDSILCP
jgi:Flp pilus assembly pilin Flp